MSLVEIKQQALELSRGDQVALKAFLDEVLHPVDPEFDRYWGAIAAERAARLRSGETTGIALEEVLKELRVHLPSSTKDRD